MQMPCRFHAVAALSQMLKTPSASSVRQPPSAFCLTMRSFQKDPFPAAPSHFLTFCQNRSIVLKALRFLPQGSGAPVPVRPCQRVDPPPRRGFLLHTDPDLPKLSQIPFASERRSVSVPPAVSDRDECETASERSFFALPCWQRAACENRPERSWRSV